MLIHLCAITLASPLQNNSLMQQIADSIVTHNQKSGYSPIEEELNKAFMNPIPIP